MSLQLFFSCIRWKAKQIYTFYWWWKAVKYKSRVEMADSNLCENVVGITLFLLFSFSIDQTLIQRTTAAITITTRYRTKRVWKVNCFLPKHNTTLVSFFLYINKYSMQVNQALYLKAKHAISVSNYNVKTLYWLKLPLSE